jgi:thymidylate synthase (FAD)
MGDDLRVANAARVSFDKQHEIFTYREDVPKGSDEGIINYLATHNHFTPFTHGMVTLRETVPIFVARQRFKHTVGFSYNEVSRRYVDSPPEFYTPESWRKRAENKKQGSLEEPITSNVYCNIHEWFTSPEAVYDTFINIAENTYNALIEAGVAPEQARMVLPQSMYTSYYVTGSLAAFARAYNLRTTDDAQYEIRELATQWDKIIRPLFPISWEALANSNADFNSTKN